MSEDAYKFRARDWPEYCEQEPPAGGTTVVTVKGKTTRKKKPLPALVVDPIPGALPFAGSRNPMTRSNTARRVSLTIALPATDHVPQVFHFESLGEWATTMDALQDPNIWGLEVQLPPFPYRCPNKGHERQHHMDIRLTFKDGYRRAIFVRNRGSLAKPETQDEIDAIFKAMPADFADDAIVVDCNDYTRAYRDNIFRIWHHLQKPDAEADAHLLEMARTTHYWLLRDLVAQCGMPPWRMWQAALRLIGRRVLCADLYAVFCHHSRVWLAS